MGWFRDKIIEPVKDSFTEAVIEPIETLIDVVVDGVNTLNPFNPNAPYYPPGTGPNGPTEIPPATEPPAEPASVEWVQGILKTLTGTEVTTQQAEFFLKVYGGPEGAKLSTEELTNAMIADGVLVSTPSESGVTWSLNYNAIDGTKAAAAIYDSVTTGHTQEGALTQAELDDGLWKLTGDWTKIPEGLTLDIIQAAGTDGAISKEQLAALIDTGAISFGAVEGQDTVAITSTGQDTTGTSFDYAGRTIETSPNALIPGSEFTTEELAVLNGVDWQAFRASILPGDDTATVTAKFKAFLGDNLGGVDPDALITKLSTFDIVTPGVRGNVFDFIRGDNATWGDNGLSSNDRANAVEDLFSFLATGVAPLQETKTFTVTINGTATSFSAATEADAVKAATDQIVSGILGNAAAQGRPVGPPMVSVESREDGTYGVIVRTVDGQTVGTSTFSVSENSDENLVDAVFLALGKDPATDTITGAEFEKGLKLVTGHEPFETPEQAEYLAQLRGTDDGTGNFTLTRDEAVSVFTSGALTPVPNVATDSGSAVSFQVNYDHTVPVHRNLHFWDTALKAVEGGVEAFVSTIASITGKSEEFVANLLNGNLSFEEAIAQGGETFLKDIADFVKTGGAEALDLLDKFGNAIKNGIEGLSDNAKAYIDLIIADAKTGAEDVAVHLLATLSGMSTEDARVALESAADKLFATDQLSGMTFEEMKALIPNFDELYAQGLAAQEEFLAALPDTTEGRKLLAEAGYNVDESGRILHAETGREMTTQDKQVFYSKYARVDVAVELNTGVVNGGVLDGLQGRLFFTMPRYDADGNQYMEFRVRELDEAGADYSGPNGGVDGGLVAVRDLVIPFYTAGPKAGQQGDVRYQSSLGVIAEGSFNLNGLVSVIPGLEGYVQTAPVDGAIPSVPNYLLRKVDFEFGAGAGFTVVHNLTQMDPSDRWKPFIGEIAGGALGAGLAIGGMLTAEFFSAGGATEYIAKYGLVTAHAAAMLGSFGVDLALAEQGEHSTVAFGAFAWGAGRLGTPSYSEAGVFAQVRGRLQFNVGYDLWNTW